MKEKIENKITKEKIERYKEISIKALEEVKKNIIKGKEKYAEEIIKMAENYINDSDYFKSKGKFIDAFAALNYAHGWIDSGVRLDIFNVSDNKLFTIK